MVWRLVALVAVVGLGFWTRAQFIAMYGGGSSAYLDWAGTHYFGAISSFYLGAAEGLGRGSGYTHLIYPPGYPIFLAAAGRLFDADPTTLRFVQAAFDAAAIAAVYILGLELGLGSLSALGAAIVYAVTPLWAAGSTFLLAESLAVPMLLWAIVLVVKSARAKQPVLAGIAGVWLGCCALVRPEAVIFIVIASGLVAAARPRELWSRVVFLLAGFVVILGVWGFHNYRVHGRWIVTSTSGGAGLWEGLGEQENPYGYALDDSAANRVARSHGYEWASIGANETLTREYLTAWRNHPMFVVNTARIRMWRILTRSDRLQPLFFGRLREVLDAVGVVALLAAAWILRNHPARVAILLALPLLALGSTGIVHFEPRYVRYVQVAYVLAAAVLASSVMATLRLSKAVAIALTVTVAAAATLYTVRELRAIHRAAETGIVQP